MTIINYHPSLSVINIKPHPQNQSDQTKPSDLANHKADSYISSILGATCTEIKNYDLNLS